MSERKWRESSGSISVNCKSCGSQISTFPSRASRKKFCGRACYASWLSKEMAGEAHPMFGKKHRPDTIAKMKSIKTEHGLKKRGPMSTNWKGGTHLTKGYRMVMVTEPELTTFATMIAKGYVPEHRLVMARSIGRPLLTSEVVHHRNGVKADNRIENLELLDSPTHKREHQSIVAELRQLRLENEALKSELLKYQRGG